MLQKREEDAKEAAAGEDTKGAKGDAPKPKGAAKTKPSKQQSKKKSAAEHCYGAGDDLFELQPVEGHVD